MFGSSSTSLFSDLEVDVTPDAPIGAMTWYAIGGRADFLIRPHSVRALQTLAMRCHRSGVVLRILGRGANLLVTDDGVDGIVVKLDHKTLSRVKYTPRDDVTILRAMAGADMANTLMDAARRGLEGLSQMAGIPATIGGAVRMNAGGIHGCIGDAIDSVTCLTKAGQLVTYPAGELRFDYRSTNIPDPVIVSAAMRIVEEDPIALRERIKEIMQFKKSSQPLAENSAGCAFKNPIDPVTEQRVSAGKLIDEAGLKGYTIGGASVSRHHANFIITEPGATAGEVVQLLDEVRRRVFDACGIALEDVIWQRDTDE